MNGFVTESTLEPKHKFNWDDHSRNFDKQQKKRRIQNASILFLSCRTSSSDLTTSPEAMTQATATDGDSDLEADVNSLPNLSDFIASDVLQVLYQSREWKLQTTINELVHTERTHLKGLKIMKKCFREPLARSPSMSPVELECIFRNLDELIDLHSKHGNAHWDDGDSRMFVFFCSSIQIRSSTASWRRERSCRSSHWWFSAEIRKTPAHLSLCSSQETPLI